MHRTGLASIAYTKFPSKWRKEIQQFLFPMHTPKEQNARPIHVEKLVDCGHRSAILIGYTAFFIPV